MSPSRAVSERNGAINKTRKASSEGFRDDVETNASDTFLVTFVKGDKEKTLPTRPPSRRQFSLEPEISRSQRPISNPSTRGTRSYHTNSENRRSAATYTSSSDSDSSIANSSFLPLHLGALPPYEPKIGGIPRRTNSGRRNHPSKDGDSISRIEPQHEVSSEASIMTSDSRKSGNHLLFRFFKRYTNDKQENVASEESVVSIGSMSKYFWKSPVDGSEKVARSGVKKMLRDSAQRLDMSLDGPSLNLAVNTILEEGADGANKGGMHTRANSISKDRFRDMCRESSLSAHKMEESTIDYDTEVEQIFSHDTRSGWRNRRVYVLWAVLYFTGQGAFFAKAVLSTLENEAAMDLFGWALPYARGFAQLCNLNAALVLLPVSRKLVTWLQSRRRIRNLFAFDGAMDAHALLGWSFFVFGMAHSILHVFTYLSFTNAKNKHVVRFFGANNVIPKASEDRLYFILQHRASITGFGMIMCMLLAVAVLGCRRKNFNRFWYLHHLFVVALLLMCFHGTGNMVAPWRTCYWLSFPLLVYLAPRFRREFCAQRTTAIHVSTSANILALRLTKPPGWDARQKAGMYAMINIPAVSRFEWHPFTISSAPYQPLLHFHIRCSGDWTKGVQDLFDERVGDGIGDPTYIPIRLEGPFGAPSQGARDYECVVLIGAGIGVTVSVPTHIKLQNWSLRCSTSFTAND